MILTSIKKFTTLDQVLHYFLVVIGLFPQSGECGGKVDLFQYFQLFVLTDLYEY